MWRDAGRFVPSGGIVEVTLTVLWTLPLLEALPPLCKTVWSIKLIVNQIQFVRGPATQITIIDQCCLGARERTVSS